MSLYYSTMNKRCVNWLRLQRPMKRNNWNFVAKIWLMVRLINTNFVVCCDCTERHDKRVVYRRRRCKGMQWIHYHSPGNAASLSHTVSVLFCVCRQSSSYVSVRYDVYWFNSKRRVCPIAWNLLMNIAKWSINLWPCVGVADSSNLCAS